jgi:hypothetical protein
VGAGSNTEVTSGGALDRTAFVGRLKTQGGPSYELLRLLA